MSNIFYERSFSPLTMVVLFFILLSVFISVFPSLNNDLLLWDDIDLVTENINTQSLALENIIKIFTTENVGTYIPLTILSFAIERHFFGLNPYVFHWVNVVLHMAVVGVIFGFAMNIGLSLRAAALAAFIFGVHPMHVESVAWISQRKDVLSSLFYVLSLWTYVRFIQRRNLQLYFISLICGFLSVLAKPMAYSLPFTLLLCDYLQDDQISVKRVLNKLPFGGLIGSISFLTLNGISTESLYSWTQGVLLQLYALIFYIIKFIAPDSLLPFYEFPVPVALTQPSYYWAMILFVALGVLCVFRRKDKLFVFAWMFYLISICILIIRVPWNFGNNTVLADRFMYLPSLGFVIYAGYLIDHIYLKSQLRNRILIILLLGIVGFTGMFVTYHQAQIWKDDVVLWTHARNYYPEKSLIYMNRAKAYAQQGRYDLAKADYQRLLQLSPQDPKTYFVRGVFFFERGEFAQSLQDFNQALVLNPDDSEIFFRRGNLFYKQGNKQLAAADYEQAIRLDPHHFKAYYNLGLYYEEQGDDRKAISFYDQSIAIEQRYTIALNNRGLLYLKQGDLTGALKDFDTILKFDRQNAQAHNNKGVIFFQSGQYTLALKEFEIALTIDPNYEDAIRNHAALLGAMRP